ncbi:MAG: MFS transporter [Bacteroidales bacterium]|nr:MFS transporter [Bacteroidales bacterium]
MKTKLSTNYRWRICALIFFATTVNYLDRSVIGILAPALEKYFGWTEMQYSYIITAFYFAYAAGMLLFGYIIDKLGTRFGYTLAISLWSISAIAHAWAKSIFGFGAARTSLGFSESGNFPASIKATSEWFPKKERALATGIFNSGANIGTVLAAALIPWLAVKFGWQMAFVATGATGFIWILFWLTSYKKPEKHKKVSTDELAYINSDGEEEVQTTKVPWGKLLKYKASWAFVLAKFFTDPIWWFYLYWLPKFLNKTYGLDLSTLGLPLVVIYTIVSVGSIGGGWLSSYFIKKGWSINRSRKLVMIISAILVIPVILATSVDNVWAAVMLIGLAAAAHQSWSANLFTVVSDIFPKRVVGSVVGLGGMVGSVGGILLSLGTGFILEVTGSYYSLFAIAVGAYIVSLFIFQWLIPRIEPIKEIA